MRIIETTFWSEPRTVLIIIKNFFVLDPSVLLHNPALIMLKDRQKIISLCTLVHHASCYELKSVYTRPEYRNRGYACRVIKKAIQKQKENYLICKEDLKSFYAKMGYKRQNAAPFPLSWRRTFYNTLIKPFIRTELIVMKKTL